MNGCFRRAAALCLVSAMLVPGIAGAQENQEEGFAPLQVGPVIVNPALTLKETWRDNVFSTENDTESDFVTSVSPEVVLRFPFRMHELSAGASADFLMYSDNSDLDTETFEFFGRGDFTIGDRVQLKLWDVYLDGEESPLDSPNGTTDPYTSNTAAFSGRYALADVSKVQLDYTRTSLDYPDSDYRTRNEDLVALYLYYRVMPNTLAFVEYDFKNVAYDDSDFMDSTSHSGLVGATWEISQGTNGTAKVGYAAKNYAEASLDDYSTWTASVDLKHQLTELASLRLRAMRDVNEPKYVDTRYYTTTGVTATFVYRFLDRLSGSVDAGYGVDTYSNALPGQDSAREDKTARFGVGAKYSFNSWLDFALNYGHTNRDSNIDGADSAENAVSLAVTAYR